MQPDCPATRRHRHRGGIFGFAVFAAVALAATAGCYDGEALVRAAHSTAVQTRLAEVDFGTFHITLPRDPETGLMTEVRLHVFGTVPRYRESEVKKQLKAEEYRVRAETLGAVRAANRVELAEPSLTKLRDRIEHVMNEVFSDRPVKSIGFYEVTLRQR
jgi:hypothetical protein